ncbi:7-cyano-7-deazaguanine synthase QueC [Roseovarius pacificus]|uniref:7-cyano-7-deazaguanine synthase QueC n=1 Tax=Roseovarius pacificus TaxID=337701 RepID=UPI002A186B59|nr:7-cyano-7-deazaguanine synthase QueC [Roseovarius pacificus]
MNTQRDAAVVLLSGGIDSTVLLHHVVKQQNRGAVHALSFHYGQRHARELDCARVQAEAAGTTEHRIIDLRFLGPLLAPGSALVAGGAEVPDLAALTEDEIQQPPTYVPNRNMMLLSMAVAFAEAQGIHDVFYGAQAQDEYGYWDCTVVFIERINAVLALNRATPVTVHAPFVTKSKAGSVRLGLELGVDFGQTWSCYRGGESPCHTCPTCIERKNAFDACGEIDPLG